MMYYDTFKKENIPNILGKNYQKFQTLELPVTPCSSIKNYNEKYSQPYQ